jgi:hypothetical protein
MRRFAITWGVFSSLILLTGRIVFFAETDILPDWYAEVPASIVLTIAGLFLVLGMISFLSIRGLQNVTRTADDDINQLMIAMDHLSVAFSTTQIIVTLLILVAIALMIVLLT